LGGLSSTQPPSFSLTQHYQGKKVLDMCKSIFGGIGSNVFFKSGSKTVMVYNDVLAPART
jgi:hypothetical protein